MNKRKKTTDKMKKYHLLFKLIICLNKTDVKKTERTV